MRLTLAILLLCSLSARAEDLDLKLPPEMKITSAVATVQALKSTTQGEVHGAAVHFAKLLPGTPYDLTITLADGTVLQGVNLGWLNEEKVDAKADPMTDDDRSQIGQLVQPDKDFFNKIDILQLTGDHNRATALVKQIRDRAFHSDKGGEIISRFEIWYFRFEYGGWEKVQQGQKILRRDRFTSHEAFEKTISPIRWTAALGGVQLEKGKDAAITLTASQLGTPEASSSLPPSTTRPAP